MTSSAQVEFTSQGNEPLYQFRKSLILPSITTALDRLEWERQLKDIPVTALKNYRLKMYENLRKFVHVGSQCPSSRPLSWCAFSKPKSDSAQSSTPFLATAAWDGQCALWRIPSMDLLLKLDGHSERATCIQFYSEALLDEKGHSEHSTSSTLALASGDVCGFVHFWSFNRSSPVASFRAHPLRISSVAFHPLGGHCSTTSYDTTWRLFDLATQREILLQEGHSKEVFCQSYHPDSGSLLATGGLDGNAAIWDIRSGGRPIHLLEDHCQAILSLDWSPNGFTLATGSEDNTIKIWDLRKKSCSETIFAHTSSVSTVKFQPRNSSSKVSSSTNSLEEVSSHGGAWLVSASHDHTAKIWGGYDWKCLVTLTAHENKIASADISNDSKFICTAGFDRSVKLWACPIG
jgi:U4/U6 small nuclear ribonucleoprotein PRP4